MVLKFLELSSEFCKPSAGYQNENWGLDVISGFVHFFHLYLAFHIKPFDLIQLHVEFHEKLQFHLADLWLWEYFLHRNRQCL